VLLVGAGVGITPIRAILEALPQHLDTEVIVRASSREDLPLRDEIASLVHSRAGGLHELLGPREGVRFDARLVRRLVPDVARRDVYVCGPPPFADRVVAAVRRLGVPKDEDPP
jgi:ferredoxin-NADP reductase